jgi:uncharacterized protein YndB with AHSA1/START domain
MSDRTTAHSTFSLERNYDVPPERVFAAWSDPEAKARWFGAAEHELDFRIGGGEVNRARLDNGNRVTFQSWYRDIVPGERIVYDSTLTMEDTLSTVSITSVQLEATPKGTRLVLVEQGTYLDGQEQPAWREEGTGQWLDALGSELSTA